RGECTPEAAGYHTGPETPRPAPRCGAGRVGTFAQALTPLIRGVRASLVHHELDGRVGLRVEDLHDRVPHVVRPPGVHRIVGDHDLGQAGLGDFALGIGDVEAVDRIPGEQLRAEQNEVAVASREVRGADARGHILGAVARERTGPDLEPARGDVTEVAGRHA